MMERRRLGPVEWAMDYRKIVILMASLLVAFGLYSLDHIKKNEFPDFTIRQGLVIAVYPGVNASCMEEEVTKPLENYIFGYTEVKKGTTKSFSRNGMAIVQVELNDDISLEEKDAFWSKFKLGVQGFKASLPQGVLALVVMDDFGDTSALLITLESEEKTYAELNEYLKQLQESFREIESIGRMSVHGMQEEQIAVYLDHDRLSRYGVSDKTVALSLMSQSLVTTGGVNRLEEMESPVYVSRALNAAGDVGEMTVFSAPGGPEIRLKDIADIVREYPDPSSYITNNGRKCLVLSVEIKKGRSITDMGASIDRKLAAFEKTLPEDVTFFKITDQARVVRDSVTDFLAELLIAIGAVILVVLLLMPMKVALVAASTIPISIFISLGLFYAFGIELNTVSLAALIVTLGMIVDNSIVIIDSYVEMLGEGADRRQAALTSARHFFRSILTATLAISVTFFPFLVTMTGPMQDFLQSFPWAITIVLFVSLLVAELLVPFLQYHFIREEDVKKVSRRGKRSFLDVIQSGYDRLIAACFRRRAVTVACGAASVLLGAFLILRLPSQLMPSAERNQFAVEISLPAGTPLAKTAQVADSLEHLLRQDPRVVSIASFKGSSSPRFQASYTPQFGGTHFAQFIVNTAGNKATAALIDEYRMRYSGYFPEAYVKFKQMTYQSFDSPVEVRLSGSEMEVLKEAAAAVTEKMRTIPELMLVRNDLETPILATEVAVREDAAGRLGLSHSAVELTLALRYSGGVPVGSIWQGDREIPVKLKGDRSSRSSFEDIANEPIPVFGGLSSVPLRQFASVSPQWYDGQICHRNGIRTVTVMGEVANGVNVMKFTSSLQEELREIPLPDGVTLSYGGEVGDSSETTPQILRGLLISVAIIFFLLLFHFKKIRIAVLLLCSLSLCLLGTAAGVLIQGVNFSLTCYLGIISLMGILVRNAIIMYDYAGELHEAEGLSYTEAIFLSAKRRMRPIFLTSAAASMGVIPMILGGSGLWMPMGAVICYGTILTMFLILTVLPVAYSLIMRD